MAGRNVGLVSGVVVVDASLAVKWLVREVHSDKAYALARSWAQEEVYPMAPYLMPVEVANALYKRVPNWPMLSLIKSSVRSPCPCDVRSSSNALASCKSAVSKPSVNQP